MLSVVGNWWLQFCIFFFADSFSTPIKLSFMLVTAVYHAWSAVVRLICTGKYCCDSVALRCNL